MTDVFSKEKRSAIMALIKQKGNLSTEIRFRTILEAAGILGWHQNDQAVFGKPDFVFFEKKTVIFIDGCFWHGCPICKNMPETNNEFWQEKIIKNILRDITVTDKLQEDGWNVIRIWEHDLKKDESIIGIIENLGKTIN